MGPSRNRTVRPVTARSTGAGRFMPLEEVCFMEPSRDDGWVAHKTPGHPQGEPCQQPQGNGQAGGQGEIRIIGKFVIDGDGQYFVAAGQGEGRAEGAHGGGKHNGATGQGGRCQFRYPDISGDGPARGTAGACCLFQIAVDGFGRCGARSSRKAADAWQVRDGEPSRYPPWCPVPGSPASRWRTGAAFAAGPASNAPMSG
uniref:CAP-Gly domain-containing protein n=1 Tax=Steinernema glaseri TaxID=37863 RepID=A0A1I8AG50_9BILA